MAARSRQVVRTMIAKDITDICERHKAVLKSIYEVHEETLGYMQTLIAQIPQSARGPLISKTPKVPKKKAVQRIKTIPEDEIIDIDFSTVEKQSNVDDTEAEVTLPTRSRREASKKAADNIRKQESFSLKNKLRRPSEDEGDTTLTTKKGRKTRSKRTISSRSSDEEEGRASKHTKMDTTAKSKEAAVTSTSKSAVVNGTFSDENRKEDERVSTEEIRRSNRKRTIPHAEESVVKKSRATDDTIGTAATDDLDEPSLYEDAIGKPVPVMNSTMNSNSTMVLDKQKLMNVTVILEQMPAKAQFNETVIIHNKSGKSKYDQENFAENDEDVTLSERTSTGSRRTSRNAMHSTNTASLRDGTEKAKESSLRKIVDELLTDDESSPERKKPVRNLKKREKVVPKKTTVRSTSSDEDVVSNTPQKPIYKSGMTLHDVRSMYKSNALFSPYAKESVRKRVEAFEQAVMSNSKNVDVDVDADVDVDVDAPTRMTRTKTRAMAAAEETALGVENPNGVTKTIAQKLARKSLAKAKKISLAKEKNVTENKENTVRQPQRVTPVEKSRIRVPMSASRIPQTPSNTVNLGNHMKAASATRGNIVTSVDSFIHPSKTIKKTNSSEKLDEKKRKLNDEDARRKREEALRLQTEEKRRKREEKELKNRLAREAKEKQELERRLNAQREREEKARLAQQQQEKQREEQERKRLAQLQRAQEKEERRRVEGQLRMQRLQEQEEAERLLAEQRHKEQEAERRKEAEARAQQQAAAEAMRLKHQLLMAQKQQLQSKKQHGPANYILDSEPDEDDTDDESRPKYAIPCWAQPEVRKPQLAMQRFIPQNVIFKFFDTRRCTPDLSELFTGIDKSRLKRTSSANWKTPPRFSMMEDD